MNIDHEQRERRLARIRIRAELARRRSERMRGVRRLPGQGAAYRLRGTGGTAQPHS